MAKLPESFIDNLLSRVDVVELIGARVPLKKQGKDYSARCPFHDERSPSFTVSPSKQFYYCFGCGAKGTAISFLMNYDRLTFMDAVEDLAKRAGIEIPKDARQHADADDGKELYAALEASSQFFQKQLAASDKAKTYLSRRGVEAKSIAQFAIDIEVLDDLEQIRRPGRRIVENEERLRIGHAASSRWTLWARRPALLI